MADGDFSKVKGCKEKGDQEQPDNSSSHAGTSRAPKPSFMKVLSWKFETYFVAGTCCKRKPSGKANSAFVEFSDRTTGVLCYINAVSCTLVMEFRSTIMFFLSLRFPPMSRFIISERPNSILQLSMRCHTLPQLVRFVPELIHSVPPK